MAALFEPRLTPASPDQPSLDPAIIYDLLRGEQTALAQQAPFTAHVFACILAIGLRDARRQAISLGQAVGLNRNQLAALTRAWLPTAFAHIDLSTEPETTTIGDEEEQLRQLLLLHQADASPETLWVTAMVARRSTSDDHLWQDLGLLDRGELNRLMTERFPRLAARNASNMKWKKFFYRMLCEMEGFSLCAAPTCRQCVDFDNCFGDESGESALARIRRDGPRPI